MNKIQPFIERIKDFIDELEGVVAGCSEEDWKRQCPWEDWSVGVTARHIAAGHFGAIDLVRAMAAGGDLPDLSMDDLIRSANRHAIEHKDTTREEVLGIIKQKGAELLDVVASLDHEALKREGSMRAAGGAISAEQLIEMVILQSSSNHLENIKAVVRR
jgi:hypothetical protein